MASYQDLETKLIGLEERVKFLMNTMRGKVITPTGVLGADGRPTATAKEVTLEEVFLMSKAQNAAIENVEKDQYGQEKVNG